MNARQKRKDVKVKLGKLRRRLAKAKRESDRQSIAGIKCQMALQMKSIPTKCEKILWNALGSVAAKNGWLIERQVVVNPYIADFVITNKYVVIEADGPSHLRRQVYDEKRDKFILAMGYRTIRLSNEEIQSDINSCLEKIVNFV